MDISFFFSCVELWVREVAVNWTGVQLVCHQGPYIVSLKVILLIMYFIVCFKGHVYF
jgi:hypothetical protein